jgi:hypothetical protein
MNRVRIGLVLMLVSRLAWSEDNGCNRDPDSVCLSVPQFIASRTALTQFQQEQPNADLTHFLIVISENSDYFEVSIFPKPIPATEVIKGNMTEITLPNPRGNRYGRSMVYNVSKKSNKIINSYSPK